MARQDRACMRPQPGQSSFHARAAVGEARLGNTCCVLASFEIGLASLHLCLNLAVDRRNSD